MLTKVHPKLPMSDKTETRNYYVNNLGFKEVGTTSYDAYLMVEKDGIEIHFFEFKDINALDNYSGIYIRTDDIDALYQSFLQQNIAIHPNGHLETKSWGQKEFSLLDPCGNLLTFGENI